MKPIYIAVFSFVVFLFSPLITPSWGIVSIEYVSFFLLSYFLFYFFFAVGKYTTAGYFKRLAFEYYTGKQHNTIAACTVLLLIGIILLLIDATYIRNYFFLGIDGVRSARELQGSNLWSVSGQISFTGGLILLDRSRSHFRSEAHKLFLYFLVLVFTYLNAISGSRGVILITCLLLFPNAFSRKNILVTGILTILVSGYFYIFRFSIVSADMSSRDIVLLNIEKGYSYFVPAADWISTLPQNFTVYVAFPILQVIQYATHGFFEFANVFEHYESETIQITGLLPIFTKLGLDSIYLERHYIYHTLAGNCYLAAGYLSPIIMGFIGLILGIMNSGTILIGPGSKIFTMAVAIGALFTNTVGGYNSWLFIFWILFFISAYSLQSIFRTR